jgi:hypothetical protein
VREECPTDASVTRCGIYRIEPLKPALGSGCRTSVRDWSGVYGCRRFAGINGEYQAVYFSWPYTRRAGVLDLAGGGVEGVEGVEAQSSFSEQRRGERLHYVNEGFTRCWVGKLERIGRDPVACAGARYNEPARRVADEVRIVSICCRSKRELAADFVADVTDGRLSATEVWRAPLEVAERYRESVAGRVNRGAIVFELAVFQAGS